MVCDTAKDQHIYGIKIPWSGVFKNILIGNLRYRKANRSGEIVSKDNLLLSVSKWR